MIRSTSFVDLVPGTVDAEVAELAAALTAWGEACGAITVETAPTAPAVRRGADLMVLAAFVDHESLDEARAHPLVAGDIRPLLDRMAAHVETVRYRQAEARVRDPQLSAGIQRTLALRVDPATPPAVVADFERALADMHRYIPAIRNSCLSPVDEVVAPRSAVWTHIWEQEFATIDGLTVDYMRHPYHWAYIDTWFDPQAPNRIVERPLVHVACDLRRSILARAPHSIGG